MQAVTRAQYLERARQLCAAVNARRAHRRREPLREQHIMRVIRLALGQPPPAVYPARSTSRSRPRSGAKNNCWALRYLEKVRDG